jgi:hypothetical protein
MKQALSQKDLIYQKGMLNLIETIGENFYDVELFG